MFEISIPTLCIYSYYSEQISIWYFVDKLYSCLYDDRKPCILLKILTSWVSKYTLCTSSASGSQQVSGVEICQTKLIRNVFLKCFLPTSNLGPAVFLNLSLIYALTYTPWVEQNVKNGLKLQAYITIHTL